MALRSLAARVRTSAASVNLQAPSLRLSPPTVGRPSAAAVRHHLTPPRLSAPSGGRSFSTNPRGGSSQEDAARKMVMDSVETLDQLVKNYDVMKARVGLLEKGSRVLKWSLAFIVPAPLVYAIAQR